MKKQSLDDMLAHATPEHLDPKGGHLSLDELACYLDGILPKARREEIVLHLGHCPRCTDRLLELEACSAEVDALMEDEPAEEPPAGEVFRLAKSAPTTSGAQPGPKASVREPVGQPSPSHRLLQAWALVATLAAFGMVIGTLMPSDDAPQDSSPDIPQMLELEASDPAEIRMDGPVEQTILLDPGSNQLVMTLDSPDAGGKGSYEGRMYEQGGSRNKLFFTNKALYDKKGFFTFAVPRDKVRGDGAYMVELWHMDSPGEELISRYKFNLRLP